MSMLPHTRDDVWREINREQIPLVYFLQRSNGDIKIGYASNFMDRISNLSRRQGTLTLLAAEPGAAERERELHDRFVACRISRPAEWFRPDALLLEYIESVAAGYDYPIRYEAEHPDDYLSEPNW